MARGEAHQLLLSQRLGHRIVQGRAPIGRIRRLDRRHQPVGVIDRSQERTDLRVVGATIEHRQPTEIPWARGRTVSGYDDVRHDEARPEDVVVRSGRGVLWRVEERGKARFVDETLVRIRLDRLYGVGRTTRRQVECACQPGPSASSRTRS